MVTIQASRTVTPIRSFFATGQAIFTCLRCSFGRQAGQEGAHLHYRYDGQADEGNGKERWAIHPTSA